MRSRSLIASVRQAVLIAVTILTVVPSLHAQVAAPCAVQTTRIVSPTPTSSGNFGAAVAVSDDGSTIAVTASGENGRLGNIYVFVRNASGAWVLEAPPFSPPGSSLGQLTGMPIALSADGGTLLAATTGAQGAGAAFVYVRSGGGWSLQAGPLLPTGAVSSPNFPLSFAATLGLSGDGNLAVFGCTGDIGGGSGAGAVYTFQRSGTVWSQVDRMQGNGFGAGMGTKVFLSSSGTIMHQYPGIGLTRYLRSGAGWTSQAGLNSGAVTGLGVCCRMGIVSHDGQFAFGFPDGSPSPAIPFGPGITGNLMVPTSERLLPLGTFSGNMVATSGNGNLLAITSQVSGITTLFLIDRTSAAAGILRQARVNLAGAGIANPLQLFSSIVLDATGATLVAGAGNDLAMSSNSAGAVYVFSVNPAAAFSLQPAPVSATLGGAAIFPTTFSGDPAVPVTFSWRRNGVAIADGPLPTGAVVSLSATSSLMLTGLTLADSGATFECVAATPCGQTISVPASLIVTSPCRADVASPGGAPTPDGAVTVDDLIRFLSDFFSSCP